MSGCDFNVVNTAMSALDYRAENRRAKSCELDFICDIEVRYGLVLEGRVEVTVAPGRVLENHRVFVADKNGKDCELDWDDFDDRVQRRINDQIFTYLDEMRLCA